MTGPHHPSGYELRRCDNCGHEYVRQAREKGWHEMACATCHRKEFTTHPLLIRANAEGV